MEHNLASPFLWLIIQVIILGNVRLGLSIHSIISTYAFTGTNVGDDALANSFEEASWWNAVTLSTSLLGSILQLCYAVTYSVYILCCVLVIFLFAWDIAYGIVLLKDQFGTVDALGGAIIIIVDAIIFGIFIYPVVGLITKIKRGVMSKETYPREAYICCNLIPDEQS